MQIALGTFENPTNILVRVISHEHIFAKKPVKKINPNSRTIKLLDRNLIKQRKANIPNRIVCTNAVTTNCSRVIFSCRQALVKLTPTVWWTWPAAIKRRCFPNSATRITIFRPDERSIFACRHQDKLQSFLLN